MSTDLITRLLEAGTPAALVAEVAMLAARADADREAIEGRRTKDRERQASRRHVTSRDVTLDSVTSCDTADATPSLDKETSPRPPKEINPNPQTGGERTRGARLPDDWHPAQMGSTTVSGEIAAKRGEDWTRRVLESFRNHWRTANGPNARKRDWQAAWANWVIEQDNRDGKRPHHDRQDRSGYRDPLLARLAGSGHPGMG